MTDWSVYVQYNCRIPECQDPCINHVDAPCTRKKLCRACYRVVDVEDLGSLTHHLPSTKRTSEGETSRVSGGASAPSAGSGESAGSGGLPPDPEARAHRATGRERQSSAEARVASERAASSRQE